MKSYELTSLRAKEPNEELTSLRAYEPRRGQLLLELLVTISVVAIIAAIVAQVVYTSLKSNQSASEKNVALGLAEETFDSVRSASTENWLNLYNLSHGTGTTTYYPLQSSGKWTINNTGTQSTAINNDTYTSSFYVQNVCRSTSSKSISGITDSGGAATSTCATSGGTADPSTQSVTASVTWSTGGPITYSDYITRWRNIVCVQSSWAGSATSSVATCPTTNFSSTSNITVGGNLQLCAGGC